jgi:UDP-2,4-diacetamido-2,4,6-trideoxy-beta-L-altropyranose hydrolase
MRCIALAQAWQNQGGDVTFLSHCDSKALRQRIIDEGFDFIPIEKPHPDPSDLTQTLNVLKRHAPCPMPHALWLVVDGYHFTPDYQKIIRANVYRLLVIDDMAHLEHYHADILLNQNIHASSLRYSYDRDAVKLLGCGYVLLRREFSKYKDWKREIPEKAKKILVTMGGGEPNNVTLKVIHALTLLDDPDLEVKIVVGPSNLNTETLKNALLFAPCSSRIFYNVRDMPELMAWADMAISAGGSTCWEMAFMGLPFLTIVLADNQAGISRGLYEEGVSLDLSWYCELSLEKIALCLSDIIHNSNVRRKCSATGQRLVDGHGSKRIVDIIVGAVK